MSTARCSNCKGLLPPWLEASGEQARCPNCGQVNKVGAGAPAPRRSASGSTAIGAVTPVKRATPRKPAPVPASRAEPKRPPSSSTGAPVMVVAQEGDFSVEIEIDQASSSAPKASPSRPVPPAPRSAPALPPAAPSSAAVPPTAASSAALPPTAPSSAAVPAVPVAPASSPAVAAPPPAPPKRRPTPAPPGTATPFAPAPSSATMPVPEAAADPAAGALPSWIEGTSSPDDMAEEALGAAAARRSRITKISAAAVGAVGLVVFAALLLRGGGARPTRPPEAVATRDKPTRVDPTPPSRKVATEVAVATPPPPPPAEEPAPERPPARAAHPRSAPAPEAPPPAEHAAKAPPAHAHPAVPSEDAQRRAREAYARGNTRLLQGGVDDAIAAFKEALKLDPRDPATQRGLGLAYLQAGNAGQAVLYLRRYLRASPAAADRQLIEKRIAQLSDR